MADVGIIYWQMDGRHPSVLYRSAIFIARACLLGSSGHSGCGWAMELAGWLAGRRGFL